MAKGEKVWSSSGVQVKKGGFEALPPGDYELKLDASKAEVRTAQGEGKFPRIGVSFTVVGTAKEGGRDRRVFHDFYIRTEPNEKGNVLVALSNQIVAFAKGLGIIVKVPTRIFNGEVCLDPIALKKWLENRDGEVVKGRLKVEKDLKGEKVNRIASFEEAETQEEEAEEETEDAPADEEDAEDEETGDEDAFSAAVSTKKAATKKKK